MKTLPLYCLVGLGLFVHPCVAQDQKPDQALAAYEKIVAAHKTALDGYQAAVGKIRKTAAYQAASKKRDRAATSELLSAVERVDTSSFITQMQKLEAAARGTAAGCKALTWVASNAGRAQKDTALEAVGLLRTHYIAGEHILPFAVSVGRVSRTLAADDYRALLGELMQHPNKIVQANAYYNRANMNRPQAKRGGGETGDRKAYEADLAECVKLAKGTPLADRAYAPIFEKNSLQVGMPVPDIIGKDLDGVEFKLSDYKGKVVMLDFWGDW